MALPLVLDCDTGTDDALAIMVAALHPGLELLGVGSVWGNHDVAATTQNTLRTLHHVGRDDVPVLRGLDAPDHPRPTPLETDDGDLLALPEARRGPAPLSAPEWLVETSRARAASPWSPPVPAPTWPPRWTWTPRCRSGSGTWW